MLTQYSYVDDNVEILMQNIFKTRNSVRASWFPNSLRQFNYINFNLTFDLITKIRKINSFKFFQFLKIRHKQAIKITLSWQPQETTLDIIPREEMQQEVVALLSAGGLLL